MDPVQSGGPWTPGPCFVLTQQKYITLLTLIERTANFDIFLINE